MIIFFFNYTATTEIYPLSQPDALPICDRADVIPPASPGKAIILTSGTTGTPKGASRSQPKSLDPAAALLDRIPLRSEEHTSELQSRQYLVCRLLLEKKRSTPSASPLLS